MPRFLCPGLVVLLAGLAATGSAADQAIVFEDRSSLLDAAGTYGDYGAMWADLDGDQRLDLVFANHLDRLLVLRQQRNGRFADMQARTGMDSASRDRHGISCADFDNDGDLDLYISNGADRGAQLGHKTDELWRNEGGFRFVEQAPETAVANAMGRGRSGHWADFDADGWLDIWAGNYRSPNVLYRGRADGRFTPVPLVVEPPVSGPIGAWADYDLDGDADLAVTLPLRLLRNDGAGGFSEHTQVPALDGHLARGLAWGDADNDGDLDLLVVVAHAAHQLMINEQGIFRPLQRLRATLRKPGLRAAAWGDMDNDGDLDALLGGDSGLWLLENLGGLEFAPLTPLSLTGEAGSEALAGPFGSPALADYDDDGRLDVAIDSTAGNRLLRNTSAGGHWLKLQLRGYRSNRMGLGARVEAWAGSQLLAARDAFSVNGGSLSGGCAPLHFGLGAHQVVDLVVHWPSGEQSRLDAVGAGQTLWLVEPQRLPSLESAGGR